MEQLISSLFGFIIIVGVVIAIHEFGHLLVAKLMGIHTVEYSLGFGKKIISKTIGGTIYSLRVIPLGGYVELYSQLAKHNHWNPDQDRIKKSDITAKEGSKVFLEDVSWWKQIVVFLAGPFSNIILAIGLLTALFMYGVPNVEPVVTHQNRLKSIVAETLPKGTVIHSINSQKIYSEISFYNEIFKHNNSSVIEFLTPSGRLVEVIAPAIRYTEPLQPTLLPELVLEQWGIGTPSIFTPVLVSRVKHGSSAQIAGIQEGDVILSADNLPIYGVSHWINFVKANPDKSVIVEIQRQQEILSLDFTVGRIEQGNKIIGTAGTYLTHQYQSTLSFPFLQALEQGLLNVRVTSIRIVKTLGHLFTGGGLDNISGVIGIAHAAGKAVSDGVVDVLSMAAIVSLSLGIFNLLPLPMLDGGQILKIIVETVRRKKLEPLQLMIYQVIGFIMILAILILTTVQDISRLIVS